MEHQPSIENKEKSPITIEPIFAHVYAIIKDGKKIGVVEIPTHLDGDTYTISDINLDEEYRGKGLGVEIYKALIEKFDKPIETFIASPEAVRDWESLERQGFAKKTEHGYRSIKH